jgi:hypothetical protein
VRLTQQESDKRNLAEDLWSARNGFTAVADKIHERLKPMELRVFAAFVNFANPEKMFDVYDRLGISHAEGARIFRRLIELGLVERNLAWDLGESNDAYSFTESDIEFLHALKISVCPLSASPQGDS